MNIWDNLSISSTSEVVIISYKLHTAPIEVWADYKSANAVERHDSAHYLDFLFFLAFRVICWKEGKILVFQDIRDITFLSAN